MTDAASSGETVSSPLAEASTVDRGAGRRFRLVSVRAGEIGWWSAAIQLAGTLAFNVSTWEATRGLDPESQELLVWVPDVVGSVCFLVASWLAIEEVCHTHRWCRRRLYVPWMVVSVNMSGSIFFGFSAIAAFVVPGSGDFLNATIAKGGTWAGALCFFVGAYLLMVELADRSPAEPT